LNKSNLAAAVSGEPGPTLRRLPVGAEMSEGGVHFRVWAPRCQDLAVEIEGLAPHDLVPEPDGYFSAFLSAANAGMRYRFRAKGGDMAWPDPASRFQPDGPHGPSQIVDPSGFAWSDAAWQGRRREELVIYEMHVGTFTTEGTWRAAAEQLAELADIGVTCIELMPIADFAGRFGWGYDGVNLFAPTRLYGNPDDLRTFVDRAHGLGIAIILDVVYNHLGPDGNYLSCFAGQYISHRYSNEWGEALNFDGPDAGPVREYFIANAGYWIDEYHLDGLRLDATQQIFDASEDHIIAAITRRVRAAGRGRATFIVGENERQEGKLVRPAERGGYGIDSLWNDDFHHSAFVALTGHHEAYYTDYRGTPREFVAAAKHGFLYQGQRYAWQKQRRGKPALDLTPDCFVVFLENHDQIANSDSGRRVHQLTSPGKHRALTAYFLLMPGIPMLLQGQEFSTSKPFLYFADHKPDLAAAVSAGRGKFLAQFPNLADPEMQARIPAPDDEATFRRCVLDFAERETHAAAYALHRDLLALRRSDPVLKSRPRHVDGTEIAERAWMLRFFGAEDDRVLIINLGLDLTLSPMPEPLLAPPEEKAWQILWTSERAKYGGMGVPPLYRNGFLHIPGESALLLAPATLDLAAAPELAEQKPAQTAPERGGA